MPLGRGRLYLKVFDMLLRHICVILLGCFNVYGYNKYLIKHLQSRYVRTIQSIDHQYANSLVRTLEFLDRPYQDNKMEQMFESACIVSLFNSSTQQISGQRIDSSFKLAQYIILLRLYVRVYDCYIKSAHKFLDDLIESKKYWIYEKFYMSQPMYRRHPVYSMYSHAYKEYIDKKLQCLATVEEEVSFILGISLHGKYMLEKIEHEDQIIEYLIAAITPLYKMYYTPYPIDAVQNDTRQLFVDLQWIYKAINKNMKDVAVVLNNHHQPSFVQRHWFGLSASAVAMIAAYGVYKQNEASICKAYEKSTTVIPNVVNDYISNPLRELYAILWEGKNTPIPDIPAEAKLKEDLKLGVDFLLKDANRTTQAVAVAYNALIQWVQDNLPMVRSIVQSQQANLYLATICPVLLASYVGLKSVTAGYNYFVKYDKWYAPMKYSLRAIDQIVNAVNRKDHHSFANDGKLYMLIMNLKQYISCLPNEELILMQTDWGDLLSFDLNYEQKHSVIERMYRTYEFLK